MSVRLGMLAATLRRALPSRSSEAVEQIADVVRPGLASGWPWKQNAGRSVRAKPCSEPSNSETCVDAHVVGQRRRIDGEAVVLAGDHHAAGVEILHRMVRAVMAELHLDVFAPTASPSN